MVLQDLLPVRSILSWVLNSTRHTITNDIRFYIQFNVQFLSSSSFNKNQRHKPNRRNRVMEKVFACFGYRAFSWVLHPPIGAFNPEHSYTVGYVLHLDWAEECMWLNKYIASKRRK
ncbi:uncharacterized protein [Spinacia oleracea]|uniref:Uncharacterized protein isoform X2 n=1 Tax=Spinacia oleracea TaxID=3562 RepID=A0ABM3QKC2_SPIOL|nr:uncharacterized protein LOC130459123 isoform X2 [Spinacia oleracea]